MVFDLTRRVWGTKRWLVFIVLALLVVVSFGLASVAGAQPEIEFKNVIFRDRADLPPTPPAEQIIASGQGAVAKVGVHEAEELVGFPIIEPSFVPEGYHFQYANVVKVPRPTTASLVYYKGEGLDRAGLLISEGRTRFMLFNDGGSKQVVTVAGVPVLVKMGEGSHPGKPGTMMATRQAVFERSGTTYVINVVNDSSLSADDMVKIAESMIAQM